MNKKYIFENHESDIGCIEEVYYDKRLKVFVFAGHFELLYASPEAAQSIAKGILNNSEKENEK